MLKTKVKAGNITNLSDARYCAGMGVDWLGFPAESVDTKTFTEITGWVTGPEFVLEINTGEIPATIAGYPASVLQISYRQLKFNQMLANYSLIVALPIEAWAEAKQKLVESKSQIQNVLVTLSGDKALDLSVLNEVTAFGAVLINLEACPYSLTEILGFGVAGVNIAGNQELKPGLKDYTELAEVLEQLEGE